MKNNTPISSIMSTNLITLSVSDKLETAEKIFKKNKIRHIPVTHKNEIIGMLSYSDLLRISFADLTNEEEKVDAFVYDYFTIQQIMAKNLTMISPNATVKEVAQLLSEREFHALPVVDNNTLVGIVTSTDLNKFIVAQLN